MTCTSIEKKEVKICFCESKHYTFCYITALAEIRKKAEAERERKRREEAGESTEGVEPGTVDWLYGTKKPEEMSENTDKDEETKTDDVVTSNMWGNDEDYPIRGQVHLNIT